MQIYQEKSTIQPIFKAIFKWTLIFNTEPPKIILSHFSLSFAIFSLIFHYEILHVEESETKMSIRVLNSRLHKVSHSYMRVQLQVQIINLFVNDQASQQVQNIKIRPIYCYVPILTNPGTPSLVVMAHIQQRNWLIKAAFPIVQFKREKIKYHKTQNMGLKKKAFLVWKNCFYF